MPFRRNHQSKSISKEEYKVKVMEQKEIQIQIRTNVKKRENKYMMIFISIYLSNSRSVERKVHIPYYVSFSSLYIVAYNHSRRI